jgi:flagellar biosynthetic protein FliO
LLFNEHYSVAGQKKKIVAFFTVIILGSGVLVALADDPNFATNSSKNAYSSFGGNQELFFKMMLSVLLLVALAITAVYVSKKLLPKITNLPGKRTHILETTYLGPKKAVHLIEIGNQYLLLGSTNENITLLADLTHAMQQAYSAEAAAKAGSAAPQSSTGALTAYPTKEFDNHVRI